MCVVSASAVTASVLLSITADHANALASTAISVWLSTMAALWNAAAMTVVEARLSVTAIAPVRARSTAESVPRN